jgi:periplasmic protein TonB
MSASALDKGNLLLWTACAVVVIGAHVGGGIGLGWGRGPDPDGFAEMPSAIVVDLAPYAPPSDSAEDLAPGPKQQEIDAPPPEPQKTEKNTDEKVDVPPTPEPAVAALPPPEPVDRPVPPPLPPVPQTTAPPKPHASPPEVNKWYGGIMSRIQHHKAYPRIARMHGEEGEVELSFSIDREGRVITSRVSRPSGYDELDREAMATIQRAQPFPSAPAGAPGSTFNFTVPLRFSIR